MTDRRTFRTADLRTPAVFTLLAPSTSKDFWYCPEGHVISDLRITGVTGSDITIHGTRARTVTDFPTPTQADLQFGTVGIALSFPSPMYPSSSAEFVVENIETAKIVGVILENNSGYSDNGCNVSAVYVPVK
mgnify:CR=1 FL=1